MTLDVNYQRIEKFIFSSCRHDGDMTDVYCWMANELGIARPGKDDDAANVILQDAYFAKYVSDEQFRESHGRFIEMMALRGAQKL